MQTDNATSGTIHLIRGNPRANREADAIFEQYQKEAGTAEKLIFRRFPMRAVCHVSCHPPQIINIIPSTNVKSNNDSSPLKLILFRSGRVAHQLLFAEL